MRAGGVNNMKNYKIAVAGTGYVGLSIATLLSQHHQVTAVDIVPEKVKMINNRKSPIQDDYIEKYLAEKELNLTATLDAKTAYADADFVVIAAPTNYDSHTQHFDTSAVEAVIKLVMEYNPNAIMVIKSTIPVGYTASERTLGSDRASSKGYIVRWVEAPSNKLLTTAFEASLESVTVTCRLSVDSKITGIAMEHRNPKVSEGRHRGLGGRQYMHLSLW